MIVIVIIVVIVIFHFYLLANLVLLLLLLCCCWHQTYRVWFVSKTKQNTLDKIKPGLNAKKP